MNYYEHHLGDYVRDTAHLSLIEDGAYRRLLDAYYIREKPLPTDVRECCKLARATSKVERDAVAYVLREFFVLADDGYHQRRADEEIERFRVKSEKARASVNARWSRTKGQGGSKSERNTNVSPTAYERITEAIHRAPVPSNQTPDTSNQIQAAATTVEAPAGARASPAVEVCKALKAAGFPDVNPMHPTLLALVEAGVTAAEFLASAPQATGKRDPFAYLLATVQGRRVDAAAVAATTPRGVTVPQRVRPLSAAEERVLEACPSIASQDLLRRAAALGRVIPNTAMEVVDVDAAAPARRLG